MSQVTLTFIVRESRSKSAVNIRVTMNTGQMKYHKAWYAYVPIGSLYPILLFVWVRLDFDLVKRQIAHYSFEIDRVKMSQQTIDCQRLLRRSCTHCQYCNGQCSEPSCDYAINGTQYNRCAWAIAFDHNEEFLTNETEVEVKSLSRQQAFRNVKLAWNVLKDTSHWLI